MIIHTGFTVPTKKNNKSIFKNRKTGKFFIGNNRGKTDKIKSITSQIIECDRNNYPKVNITVDIVICNSSSRVDLDNQLNTIMDCLCDAGKIPDDCTKYIKTICIENKFVKKGQEGFYYNIT